MLTHRAKAGPGSGTAPGAASKRAAPGARTGRRMPARRPMVLTAQSTYAA
jgi:hypothetical protein